VTEGSRFIIVGAKKSSTAELRLQFDNIEALVKEGYKHNQICEQLITQGLEISYSYYRVIMTRLRAEKRSVKGVAATAATLPQALVVSTPSASSSPDSIESLASHDKRPQARQFVYDTQREVTWEKG
jgi:hypothetical protein